MNKLVIDTANDCLLVALEIGDQVFSCVGESKSRHNESLIPMIDKILAERGLDINGIHEFGVIVGPGSFTGIRVGIATIKAFRDVLNVQAKGINNLDYLFRIAHDKDENIKVVAIKGSRNSYFVARLVNDTVYKYERNLTLEELRSVAGDGRVGMFSYDEDVNTFVIEPDAKVLMDCFNSSNDDKLIPIYYQLSQAENEKMKRGNVEISESSIEDVDTISRIEYDSIANNPLSKDKIACILQDKNYKTFKAVFDGSLVGFIILEITDELNIMSIAVDKNYRNLGLATKLIEKAREYARLINVNMLSLEVGEKNITAYLLYEKLGFVKRRIRKNYYQDGSNAIEMIREV